MNGRLRNRDFWQDGSPLFGVGYEFSVEQIQWSARAGYIVLRLASIIN